MRILILSILLAACGSGSYQVGLKEEKTTSTTDSSKNQSNQTDQTTGTNDTKNGDSGSTTVPDSDTTKALTYQYFNLNGVKNITSSAKIVNTLYFTAEDSEGNPVLGIVKPDSTKVNLLPFGRMNANGVTLSGDYYLVTNLDDSIYLMNDTDIIQIDLTTLQAIQKVSSPCAVKAPLVFVEDSRWHSLWDSKDTSCGMADGTQIEQKSIVDGYTGQTLTFDNYGSWSFDSVNLWRYQPVAKQLIKYDSSFTKKEVYSTSAYRYNADHSTFISDSNGGMWFFGCGDDGCYSATVSIVEQ